MKNNALTSKLKNIAWQEYILYFGFLVIFVAFAIVLRDRNFLTLNNFMGILRQTAPIAVMAVGMTFSIATGQTDLSIGRTVALSAIVTAMVLRDHGIIPAVCAGLGVGLIIGFTNGFLVSRVGIPAFLATLGTSNVVNGLVRDICNLNAVPIANNTFNFIFGSGSIGPVSVLVIWTFVVTLIGHIVFKKTPYGRRVIATGGNQTAAKYSGVNVKNIRMSVLVISSFAAALAGLLYAGRLNSARYTFGEQDGMTVIASVVIGGTSFSGGGGTVLGSILGALVMGILNNGLILMGLSVDAQLIAKGIIIVLAVALSSNQQIKSE